MFLVYLVAAESNIQQFDIVSSSARFTLDNLQSSYRETNHRNVK